MSEISSKNPRTDQYINETGAKYAPFLGKWLWFLFWMLIPSVITGIMTNDFVMKNALAIYIAGQFLSIACSIIYSAVLFKLSAAETRYRIAGICYLVSASASLFILVFPDTKEFSAQSLIFLIPAAIISVTFKYFEYSAHSAILASVDNSLSLNWITLRKWCIGFVICFYAGSATMTILPLPGAVIVLGVSICLCVIGIFNLIYLYRTAMVFRNYK